MHETWTTPRADHGAPGPASSDPQTHPSVASHGCGDLSPYDQVVVMSFGGPEQADEVMPFLRRVTRGRGVPDERLAVVAEHYYAHGGRSPINDQCRALVSALEAELARRGLDIAVTWGARNSEPYIADVLADAANRGRRRAVMLTTSAYPSYSSCRQYREDVAGADPGVLQVDRIRQYALTPGFIGANADAVVRALRAVPRPDRARILFVTHSIPNSMADASGPACRPPEGSYVAWHQQVTDRVLAAVRHRLGASDGPGEGGIIGELVYCSRSGPPTQPWLEPDVNDRLRQLSVEDPDRPVVLSPIGFVSDHMEVINDLDAEALTTAAEAGLTCVRAATAGTDPQFVSQLVDELLVRAEQARVAGSGGPTAGAPTPEQASAGPGWTPCPDDCCVNLRRPELAVIP